MSLLCLRNDLEQCLGRLDDCSSPLFIVNRMSPMSPSPDSPYSQSSLPACLPDRRTSRPRVHTSSYSGSIRYPRDSISAHPKSSESIRRLSFLPLPSPLLRSDFHSTFQSFVVPPTVECPLRPPNLSRLPRLSQPLFEKKAMDVEPIFSASFNHPNSPYVPLASPVRREFFRPLTPESYVSRFSGYSRSGAIAPEPWDHELYHSATFMKMSNNIRKIRRTVRRKLSKVARRFAAHKRPFTPVENKSSSWQPALHTSRLSLPEALPIRVMSHTSFDTTHTNSLAQWLNARHQAFINSHEEGYDMTLEDYERIGSWINFNSGHGGTFGCGVTGCRFHQDLSAGVHSLSDEGTASDDDSRISLAPEASDTTCHSNHSQKACSSLESVPFAQPSLMES